MTVHAKQNNISQNFVKEHINPSFTLFDRENIISVDYLVNVNLSMGIDCDCDISIGCCQGGLIGGDEQFDHLQDPQIQSRKLTSSSGSTIRPGSSITDRSSGKS